MDTKIIDEQNWWIGAELIKRPFVSAIDHPPADCLVHPGVPATYAWRRSVGVGNQFDPCCTACVLAELKDIEKEQIERKLKAKYVCDKCHTEVPVDEQKTPIHFENNRHFVPRKGDVPGFDCCTPCFKTYMDSLRNKTA